MDRPLPAARGHALLVTIIALAVLLLLVSSAIQVTGGFVAP